MSNKSCQCTKCGTIHSYKPINYPSQQSKLKKLALFIDGANLYRTVKKLGFKIDYFRLRDYFLAPKDIELFKAFYYSAYDPNEPFIMKIHDKLRYNNFEVKTKLIKRIKVAKGSFVKGDMDVNLALDLCVRYIDNYDIAVLVSGDGDFKDCVDYLQENGKKIYCVSSEVTTPPMVSYELKDNVDLFIELNDIKNQVSLQY
jgi:uncharacterized LabA/DUF88 family protein